VARCFYLGHFRIGVVQHDCYRNLLQTWPGSGPGHSSDRRPLNP
jgi:hypothetical protein